MWQLEKPWCSFSKLSKQQNWLESTFVTIVTLSSGFIPLYLRALRPVLLTLVMYFFPSFILCNLSIRDGNKGSTSMKTDFPKQKRDAIPRLLDPFPT